MGTHTSGGNPTREILDALRRIVQALRQSSRRAEQDIGMSGAQLFVLETLADAPALSLNQLAAKTHTHQSSVSTVVSRLVERGYVKRHAAADKRQVTLTLSASGQRVVAQAPDTVQQRLVRSIDRLGPRARQRLAAALVDLVRGMDVDRDHATMFFDEPSTHTRKNGRRR